jgi:hypothetical protein
MWTGLTREHRRGQRLQRELKHVDELLSNVVDDMA